MNAVAERWLAEYARHLELGAARLEAGEALPPSFGARCQELDEGVRQLGGDALREAARGPAGPHLLANLRAASARFERLLGAAMSQAQEQLSGAGKARHGLNGYAATGQWLKATGGRYIERSG